MSENKNAKVVSQAEISKESMKSLITLTIAMCLMIYMNYIGTNRNAPYPMINVAIVIIACICFCINNFVVWMIRDRMLQMQSVSLAFILVLRNSVNQIIDESWDYTAKWLVYLPLVIMLIFELLCLPKIIEAFNLRKELGIWDVSFRYFLRNYNWDGIDFGSEESQEQWMWAISKIKTKEEWEAVIELADKDDGKDQATLEYIKYSDKNEN